MGAATATKRRPGKSPIDDLNASYIGRQYRTWADSLTPAQRKIVDDIIRGKLSGDTTASYEHMAAWLQQRHGFKRFSPSALRNYALTFRGAT